MGSIDVLIDGRDDGGKTRRAAGKKSKAARRR
jgi:hypothetical protein